MLNLSEYDKKLMDDVDAITVDTDKILYEDELDENSEEVQEKLMQYSKLVEEEKMGRTREKNKTNLDEYFDKALEEIELITKEFQEQWEKERLEKEREEEENRIFIEKCKERKRKEEEEIIRLKEKEKINKSKNKNTR